jgi:hypothetical protein
VRFGIRYLVYYSVFQHTVGLLGRAIIGIYDTKMVEKILQILEHLSFKWIRCTNRGEAFILAVLVWLTLWKTKQKVAKLYFRSLAAFPHTGTQQNRSDKM